jgi:hypothetical protein
MKTILVMLFLTAAAFAQDESAVARLARAACGPDDTQFDVKTDRAQHAVSAPETGKALVYVIEQEKHRGLKSVTTRVGLDGAWIGANRGDSYFFFSVAPGEHHLCSDWRVGFAAGGGKQVSLANFTAETGRVYYFRVRTMGAKDMGNILDLDPINSDEGQFLVAASAFSSSSAKK